MICRKTIRLRRKRDYKRMCLWASITKGLQTYGSRLGYYRFLLRTDVITGKVSTNTLLHPNPEYANTMGNQIGREWKQMKWNDMVWISLMFSKRNAKTVNNPKSKYNLSNKVVLYPIFKSLRCLFHPSTQPYNRP